MTRFALLSRKYVELVVCSWGREINLIDLRSLDRFPTWLVIPVAPFLILTDIPRKNWLVPVVQGLVILPSTN